MAGARCSETGIRVTESLAGNGERSADAHKMFTEIIYLAGRRRDDLDLMPLRGKVIKECGDMASNPTRMGEIIRRYQCNLHYLLSSSLAQLKLSKVLDWLSQFVLGNKLFRLSMSFGIGILDRR